MKSYMAHALSIMMVPVCTLRDWDIWGDWREEMIFPSSDYTELRIFTTDFETQYRIRPLMEDHIYRLSAAHQNIGYNQPTHTGFYLGSDKTDYSDFK